jgi:hypothetical protein
MPYEAIAKNRMLDALIGTATGNAITHASLHTADPAATSPVGGAEATGGSPAYARKSITFSAASAGAVDSSNQPVFDVAGGTTVTHVGFWTAVSGGVFMASANVTDEAFGGQGTYTLTDADMDLNS